MISNRLFSYLPGFSPCFDRLELNFKHLIMLVSIIISSFGSFGVTRALCCDVVNPHITFTTSVSPLLLHICWRSLHHLPAGPPGLRFCPCLSSEHRFIPSIQFVHRDQCPGLRHQILPCDGVTGSYIIGYIQPVSVPTAHLHQPDVGGGYAVVFNTTFSGLEHLYTTMLYTEVSNPQRQDDYQGIPILGPGSGKLSMSGLGLTQPRTFRGWIESLVTP